MPRGEPTIFTIGHSNHALDDFLALLAQHRIGALVDIRRFPGSRKWPHFNREPLAEALAGQGIEYQWLEALGGRRKAPAAAAESSPNWGLRNPSFRNYADYMLTADFRAGIADLLKIARRRRTAIMCAESVFWRCHRRLVSDYLVANGVTVQDIFPHGELKPHALSKEAQAEKGRVTYPPPQSLFDDGPARGPAT